MSEEEKMTRYLTGNWKAAYLKMEMPSYKKRDTLVEYDIDFQNPGDPRATRNLFYKHKADGTFEHWEMKNGRSLGKKSLGKWRAIKDSLYYEFIGKEKSIKASFGLVVIEDGYAITAAQDRDRDGTKDDTFYMETIRIADDSKD